MKLTYFLGFLMIAVVLSSCTGQKTEKTDNGAIATNSVEIKGFAYVPANITIAKGTIVTWTQMDSAPHTVTILSGAGFDSGNLNKGQMFNNTFNEAGTFEYGCLIHPGMKGKVIVPE